MCCYLGLLRLLPVSLCTNVFTLLVPCFDVHYDFLIQVMFGSSVFTSNCLLDGSCFTYFVFCLLACCDIQYVFTFLLSGFLVAQNISFLCCVLWVFSCLSTFCVSCARCYQCLVCPMLPVSQECNAYFHLQFYRLIGCFLTSRMQNLTLLFRI